MRKHFGQIFWGMVLVALDLRINDFDLLPDFLGFILIALGCRGLIELSKDFSTAQNLSWVMAALSLIEFFVPRDGMALFSVLATAVHCAMIWFLLGGMMEFAVLRQRPDLSERASKYRNAYILLRFVATLTIIMLQDSKEVAGPLAMVLVICGFVLTVFILHLIHRVRKELC